VICVSAYAWHIARRVPGRGSRDIGCGADQLGSRPAGVGGTRLPANDPERTAMRHCPENGAVFDHLACRELGVAEHRFFDELRGLCSSAGDDVSLAIGMHGQVAGPELRTSPPGGLCAGFPNSSDWLRKAPRRCGRVRVIHGAVFSEVVRR